MPDQCKTCILFDICRENNCMKDKPCQSRLDPVPVDVDLFNEMKERMGF